jgi:hypothetical protein
VNVTPTNLTCPPLAGERNAAGSPAEKDSRRPCESRVQRDQAISRRWWSDGIASSPLGPRNDRLFSSPLWEIEHPAVRNKVSAQLSPSPCSSPGGGGNLEHASVLVIAGVALHQIVHREAQQSSCGTSPMGLPRRPAFDGTPRNDGSIASLLT